MKTRAVDVAIIGGGPAGLAAAVEAREAGARDVVVLERSEAPGGLLEQCIHDGFGLLYFQENMTGPEFAHRFVEKAMDSGVDLRLSAMVTGLTPDRVIKAFSAEGMIELRAGAVVLAMGCREKTREAIMIPGTRPAGIFTAGTAQRYVNVEGFIPGKEIVILGSGDVGMIMARRLTLEGATVKAVVEVLPYVGGLIRNEVQCLVDFDIPVFLGHTVAEIHGYHRVEAVTIAKVDENFQPVAGTQQVIGCDTLLVSVGLIPENELSVAAGVHLDALTGGPLVDECRQTNIPGIFAAGNVAHVHDLVDNVVREGEIAGASAALYASGRQPFACAIRLKPGKNIRYVVPHVVSGENDVVISMRVKEPAEHVSLKAANTFNIPHRFVKPNQTIRIEVSADQWRSTAGGGDQLEIDCEER